MKLLLPVDGSKFTKKALAFLVTHDEIVNSETTVFVLNVQAAVSPRVSAMVGTATVRAYQHDEARRVLDPIKKFLDRHKIEFRSSWAVGQPAKEIIKLSKKEKVHMIVMGTHGHGFLGQALMGSIAQRIVVESEVPVLLVK
jgi:nucleotide-binding universal stress UspA family protein